MNSIEILFEYNLEREADRKVDYNEFEYTSTLLHI